MLFRSRGSMELFTLLFCNGRLKRLFRNGSKGSLLLFQWKIVSWSFNGNQENGRRLFIRKMEAGRLFIRKMEAGRLFCNGSRKQEGSFAMEAGVLWDYLSFYFFLWVCYFAIRKTLLQWKAIRGSMGLLFCNQEGSFAMEGSRGSLNIEIFCNGSKGSFAMEAGVL